MVFGPIGHEQFQKRWPIRFPHFSLFSCLTSFCEETVGGNSLNFGILVTWEKVSIYANFQVFGTNLHSMIFFKNGVICAKNMFVQNHNVGSLLMFDPQDFNSFSKVVINCQTVPLCQYSHNLIP